MKKIFTYFITSTLSLSAFSQSTAILPSSLDVPNLAVLPNCDTGGKGRLVFNTRDNKMYFCNGTAWTDMTVGGFSLPYSGSNSSSGPNSSFSITDRGSGRSISGENIGGGIGVYGSSTDGTAIYGNATDGLGGSFLNNSLNPTLYIRNIGKGKAAEIIGDVSITSDLTVKNNKGVAYNQNSATNLRLFQYTYLREGVTSLCGGCTSSGSFEFTGGFTVKPSVFVGDRSATSSSGPSFILMVSECEYDSVTKVTGCNYTITNTSSGSRTATNLSFNCLAIGY